MVIVGSLHFVCRCIYKNSALYYLINAITTVLFFNAFIKENSLHANFSISYMPLVVSCTFLAVMVVCMIALMIPLGASVLKKKLTKPQAEGLAFSIELINKKLKQLNVLSFSALGLCVVVIITIDPAR